MKLRAMFDNTDLALQKTTALSKGMSVELRAEAFNVFNHGQFFGPAAVSGNISSTNFGQVQSSSSPRLLQLAARLRFSIPCSRPSKRPAASCW